MLGSLPEPTMSRDPAEWLDPGFFARDPVDCAKELIGCHFVWKGCAGRIVETEGYRAEGDEACHTFFRPSVREFVATHKSGDSYVYLNYGVHWLFNILVKGEAGDGFVLLRALEPLEGIGEIRRRRANKPDRVLMSGPGRLTQALGIGREDHGSAFLGAKDCGILRKPPPHIICGPRVGISKATDLPWRFGDAGSRCLSRSF